MVLNYSQAEEITVDVVICKPVGTQWPGQGEVIMSSSHWSDGPCTYHMYMDVEFTQNIGLNGFTNPLHNSSTEMVSWLLQKYGAVVSLYYKPLP